MVNWIFLTPIIVAVALLFLPRKWGTVAWFATFIAMFVSMVLAISVFFKFDPSVTGIQFEHKAVWVQALGINFHTGVDGINVGLLLMGAIVAFTASCLSWDVKTREKEFSILLLLMSGGILGAFASFDMFFFYFFHELALIPTFIMIGVWGQGENKNYATFQITIYLTIGALITLFGLILLYVKANANTFDIVDLSNSLAKRQIESQGQSLIFPILMVGFGTLVSLFPFYSWAPPGYAAAPAPAAMMHAGVIKKFGLLGFLRICIPLLPQGAIEWTHILAVLCVGNMLYCGWVAMQQKNLNMLFGFSSVAHMGFAFLGIASLTVIGLTGAVVIMIAHGLLAALSFGLSGWYQKQTGTLEFDKMGGFLKRLPFMGTALLIAMFAGCGLPGFANFVGELLVFFGAWKDFSFYVVLGAWGALVIGAIYMLGAARKILHGELKPEFSRIRDAQTFWRKIPYSILIAALLFFGIFPVVLTKRIEPSVKMILKVVDKPENKAQMKPLAPTKIKKSK
ncbi:MAG TPA: NADH-quinone oxidoreductase subunit M [Verrucomicrobiota bacterium]|mgnify:FL=1|nr:NADH-quinone oxidoreductase subunit M [Verrucomicrobiota bacterium]